MYSYDPYYYDYAQYQYYGPRYGNNVQQQPMTANKQQIYDPYQAEQMYRAQANAVRVEQPSQTLKYNKSFWHPLGWMRVLIILCLLGGIISSWLIISNPVLYTAYDSLSTRDAAIVIFSVTFTISLFNFLISISNFANLPGTTSKCYLITVIDHAHPRSHP